MTGPEHYAEAERLLAHADSDGSAISRQIVAEAQVHATLALTAAQSTPSVPPGPCSIQAPAIGRARREFCDLLAGHAGLHVAGASVWGEGIA